MSDEPKPCPFCRQIPIIVGDSVVAPICDCIESDFGYWIKLKTWNTRPAEPRCDQCTHGFTYEGHIKCCSFMEIVEADFYCKHFERIEDE
jgi:hypothetical protein